MHNSRKSGKRTKQVQPLRPSGTKLERLSHDVTEQKETEKALEYSEQRCRALVESSHEVIFCKDQDGHYHTLNLNAAIALGGTCIEDIEGKTDYDLLPKEQADDLRRIDKEIMDSGKNMEVEEVVRDARGEDRIYLSHKWPMYDSQGRINGISCFAMDITKRKRAEKALKYRLEFEKTVRNISSRFVGTLDIDNAIDASLADIGCLSGASRAYLFKINQQAATMSNTHEWCAEGVSPQIDNLQNLPCDDFNWWIVQLRKGDVIHITDASKLPKQAEAEKQALQSQNIKSLLVLPLYSESKLTGFIGLDNVVKTAEWKDEDLELLRLSSNIISEALKRKHAERIVKRLNKCFLSLGKDALSNIQKLAETAGEILGGACVLYNRLEGKLLCTWGIWHTPQGYNVLDNPEGHICYDVIKEDKDEPLVIEDLTGTIYEKTDPNVQKYGLKSYLGYSVKLNDKTVGSFCQCNIEKKKFTQTDYKIMSMLAKAITIEEERKQAEQDLVESEKKYRELVETSQDMIFLLDLNGNFKFTNQAWSEHVGYSYDEAIKLNGFDLVHPEDLNEVKARFSNVVKGHAEKNVEFRSKTKSGEYRNVLINGTPVFDSELNVMEVLGAGVDITERKKAELTLQRKTEQQQRLLKIAHNLTASLDTNKVLRQIATGAMEILKTHACAIYLLEDDGQTLSPVVAIEPPYEKEILSTILKVDNSFTGCAVKAKRSLVFNDAAVNSSGYHIPGTPPVEDERILVAPFIVGEKILGAICLNRIGIEFNQEDLILVETFATYAAIALNNAQAHRKLKHEVEERKQVEKALRKSKQEKSAILESMSELVIYQDTEHKVIWTNRAARDSISMTAGQLVGRRCYELWQNRSEPCNGCPVAKARQTGQSQTAEMASPGGRTWLLNGYPIKNDKGEVTGIVELALDITNRKKAEQKLLEYQGQLKSLASELSMTEERERLRLAVGLHDQIGQQLALTKLALQSLKESTAELANKKENERLNILNNTSSSLDNVCNTIDQVIENAHSLTFELSNPILYELGFEAAVENWLSEQIREKHGINYKFDTGSQPLQLDSKMDIALFRAVRELLTNVVKHAQAENVAVSVQGTDDKIQISVADDGVGFRPSNLQSSLSENKKKGFGLFSIREQIEYLGGNMKIKSAPRKGTCIILNVPLKL